jgi:hypothetical protein
MKTKFISLAATLLLAASANTVLASIPIAYYLVGSEIGWEEQSKYQFEYDVQNGVFTLTCAIQGEFKIRSGNMWYGTYQYENDNHYLYYNHPTVTLNTNGDNKNLYLLRNLTYTFTFNPSNNELTVSGFNLYIVGDFNEWTPEQMTYNNGTYSIEKTLKAGDKFKFRDWSDKNDQGNRFYGGDVRPNTGDYGIHNDWHTNILLTEGDLGKDFIIKRDGTYTFIVNSNRQLTVEGFPPLVYLDNDATDNEATLKQYYDNNQRTLDIVLKNRTLKKDGNWNTICLPFDASITDGPLNGAIVYRLKNTSNFSDGSLSLDFERFYGISRIKPYLIKWEKPENYNPETDDIKNPRFDNVELHAYLPNWDGNDIVKMKGCYDATTIEGNQSLYLGEGNTLYWPDPSVTIGAFRGYFELAPGITAGEPLPGEQGIKSFVLNFDEETTSIKQVNNAAANASAWYTLDGRRMNEKPAAAGLYINNGKKVVIK